MSSFSSGVNQWPFSWQSATGLSYPVVEISKNKNILFTSGYVLDRVVETGGILEKEYYESQPGHPALEIQTIMKQSTEVFKKRLFTPILHFFEGWQSRNLHLYAVPATNC